MYYAKARYYDTDLGTFLSSDPFEGYSDMPPSLNKYLYAFGNPTVYIDPTGLVAEVNGTDLSRIDDLDDLDDEGSSSVGVTPGMHRLGLSLGFSSEGGLSAENVQALKGFANKVDGRAGKTVLVREASDSPESIESSVESIFPDSNKYVSRKVRDQMVALLSAGKTSSAVDASGPKNYLDAQVAANARDNGLSRGSEGLMNNPASVSAGAGLFSVAAGILETAITAFDGGASDRTRGYAGLQLAAEVAPFIPAGVGRAKGLLRGKKGSNALSLPAEEIGSPYFVRINPNTGKGPMAIDSSTFTSGKTTMNGGIRNSKQFWTQWKSTYPETLSSKNLAQIEARKSPVVDDQWINNFKEHSNYLDETIIHHHLDYGPDAIPLPSSVHSKQPGWGMWHTEHSGK